MHCRLSKVMKSPVTCQSVISPCWRQLSVRRMTNLAHQTQIAKLKVLTKHLGLLPQEGYLRMSPAARAAAAWIRSSLSCIHLLLTQTATSPAQQAQRDTQWGQCTQRGLSRSHSEAPPMTAVRHAQMVTWLRMAKQQRWLSWLKQLLLLCVQKRRHLRLNKQVSNAKAQSCPVQSGNKFEIAITGQLLVHRRTVLSALHAEPAFNPVAEVVLPTTS